MSSSARSTTDHEKIKKWVEERGGRPAMVKGTAKEGRFGVLRIDFPGYTGEETLEPITWDEFFWAFDENKLAFLFQEETKDGDESRFSKLINRDSAKETKSAN